MKIFAVSDLHLPGNQVKPMDVFGENWTGHFKKIRADWREKVSPEDVVLLAGDFCWAMTLQDALSDLAQLSDLPGKKVLIRGNHDYWWSGITTLRRNAPDETFFFLQNDCIRIQDWIFCGSRGWACPGSTDFDAADEKIYLREGERFRLAFNAVNRERREGDKLLCMIHFPPFNAKKESSLFTDLFEKNDADVVVYGHLHQSMSGYALEEYRNGIRYCLTSCDLLGFRLARIV